MGLIRQQQTQSQQVAAAAGSAVVTAARVGRLLGRTGWRLAKQLPGATMVEAQALRLGTAIAGEFARLLDAPGEVFGGGTPEEQRAMRLLQNAATDTEPLRSAMSELLERSAESDGSRGSEYLYGTIVSQLVPDEARILAALTGGREYAAIDVVVKPSSRAASYVELANESTVGLAAKVSAPQNTATYLTRLHTFGLVEFSTPGDGLHGQFDVLRASPGVQQARSRAHAGGGKTRIVRKRVMLSKFGAEFWAACAPSASPAQ